MSIFVLSITLKNKAMFPKNQIRKCIVSLSLQPKSQLMHNKPTHHLLFYSISSRFLSSLQPSEKPLPLAEYLINQHQFSPKTALKASSTIPFVKNPQKSDSTLSYLKERGFSKTHLEKLVSKFPQVFSVNLTTIEAKIKVLRDSGFSVSDVAHIVSNCPWILKHSADNKIGPTISALKRILGSNEAVFTVIKRSCWIPQCDLEKTVLPNIEYLNKSCGISLSQITNYLCRNPRHFLLKPESMAKKVRRVEEMGFDLKSNSNMLLEGLLAVNSMTLEKWELKLNVFRTLGCSDDKIMGMFVKAPHIFRASERRLKKAVDVFLTHGGVDMLYLVEHPSLLSYSVDRRVKPRLQVVDILRRKDFLRKRPALTTIMIISDKKFLELFVLPYSDALGNDLVAALKSKQALSPYVMKVPILEKR